jgi:hypothetical protein
VKLLCRAGELSQKIQSQQQDRCNERKESENTDDIGKSHKLGETEEGRSVLPAVAWLPSHVFQIPSELIKVTL